MLHPSTQYKLCVLQGLVVEQPIQFCPLRWSIAVLVIDGGAVNGNGGAILEPGFHPVGVHVVAAGKQFRYSRILQDLIFGVRSLKPMPSSQWGIGRFYLSESKCTVSARILHGFCTVSKRAEGANR